MFADWWQKKKKTSLATRNCDLRKSPDEVMGSQRCFPKNPHQNVEAKTNSHTGSAVHQDQLKNFQVWPFSDLIMQSSSNPSHIRWRKWSIQVRKKKKVSPPKKWKWDLTSCNFFFHIVSIIYGVEVPFNTATLPRHKIFAYVWWYLLSLEEGNQKESVEKKSQQK